MIQKSKGIKKMMLQKRIVRFCLFLLYLGRYSESIFNMYGLSSISAAGLRPAADNYHCLCKRKWFINQNLTHAEQQLPHGLVDRIVDFRSKGWGLEPTLGRKFLHVSFIPFIISITRTITSMQKFIIFCNAKNNKFLH